MRKTKIICTIGPASCDLKILKQMCANGMNYARINMSHGSIEEHQKTADIINKVPKKFKLGLLVDTQGPEIRIKNFKNGEVVLKDGQSFTFTTKNILGDENLVSLKYKGLIDKVKVGTLLYCGNGTIVFKVTKKTSEEIKTKVIYGGKLSNNKGINVPGVMPEGVYLSANDKKSLLFAIKNKAKAVALSFVCEKQNVIDAKKYLVKNGGKNIKIIAKIENALAVQNIEEILQVCDGVMVARGDLGAEIPLEKVPNVQKAIISHANIARKFVIVATEMLESMISSPRPTRAEVSDVAYAIYEEANAVMLSGETAVGKFPVLAVETLTKIVDEAENYVYRNNV